jgi:hypothetical protein
VSIRLSPDAARELSLEIGPGVTYVEGVVVAEDSSGLRLAVNRVESGGENIGTAWTGEQFTFRRGTYLTLQERHLNVPGTALVSGLAVGAVVALREAFFNTGGTANVQPGGPVNPPQ